MSTSSPIAGPRPTVRPVRIDDLLAEQQQRLTAVEEFSRVHDTGQPSQARFYESLIPATPPAAGEQYAFEVDLDACSGCKACVTACHSLNGLADDESWRDVGLLHGVASSGDDRGAPVLQHVTTACHHCLDPGCLKGCPTNAYEKDPRTGIVRHLDDQCFGCQYCTLTCPYEVPKYHAEHGIVRKCDMCSDRLIGGEAPACVQACPHEAIRIRKVAIDGVRAVAAKASVCEAAPARDFAIPHAPPLQHTIPTTRYTTTRVDLSGMEPADLKTPKPAHAHGPLTVMLALTQIGVGAFVAAAVLLAVGVGLFSPSMKMLTLTGLGITNIGLIAATLHLGRPHLAYRAVLGWRHSWLSREAIAFAFFMPVAVAATVVTWADVLAGLASSFVSFEGLPLLVTKWWISRPVITGAAVAGIGAVFTSVMIYAVTRKPLWNVRRTTVRFLLTTLIGGASLALASEVTTSAFQALTARNHAVEAWNFVALAAFVAMKLGLDFTAVRVRRDLSDPDSRTAFLLRGELKRAVVIRLGLTVGGVVLAAIALFWPIAAIPAVASIIGGELVERWLFFTAVTGPKMPGGMPA